MSFDDDNAYSIWAGLKALVGLPALILGLAGGLPAMIDFRSADSIKEAVNEIFSNSYFFYWGLAWLAPTIIVLLIRPERWGVSLMQLRLVWFGAFLLGLLGGPFVIWWIDR